MDFFLNRQSDLPIRRQIRGMIEYAITFGFWEIGTALPSVRDLAKQLDVAPMTISNVYSDLKRDGLIDARAGAGTYVLDSARAKLAGQRNLGCLHGAIDTLLDQAEAAGLAGEDIALLIQRKLMQRTRQTRSTTLAVVGLFPEATRSYAEAIAAQLGRRARVESATLRALQDDPTLRARIGEARAIVTFLTLNEPVAALFPHHTIIPVRFIPSETTRLALAGLNPLAKVALVSHFPAFLPILRFGVTRFAPHCDTLSSHVEDDPDLARHLAQSDVVIFATGAEGCATLAPAQAKTIEYRHIPDPGDIDRLLRPLLEPAPSATRPTQETA